MQDIGPNPQYFSGFFLQEHDMENSQKYLAAFIGSRLLELKKK